MAEKVVSVKLQARVDGFVGGMRKAKASVDDLTKAAAPNKAQAFENLSNKAALAGVGIATAVGVAVKRFADFDQAMSAVQANSGATGATLDSLRKAAIELGADSQFSATEAAQGINEMAKAGVEAGDILGGGLKGALDLAAAGQISVADAAETAATAMTQFKLSGDKVPHIADLLANAANKAQGGVGDMAQALKQAGLVASSTGLSIEETTAGLTAFASAGLIGSDAGTSFKTMLQRLSAPTGKAAELMTELGISAYDSQGNFIGLANVAGQLTEAFKDKTVEERNSAMATIFGSDAIRAANVLYEQGATGINRWTKEVSEQGAAAKQAAALTDNLKGDVERLGGALDSVFIQTGSSANGSLRGLVQGVTGLVDAVGDVPGPLLLAGGSLAAFALLAPKGVTAYREYVGQLDSLGLSLDKITAKAPRTGKALDAAGKAAKGFGTALAAAAAVDVLFLDDSGLPIQGLTKDLLDSKDAAVAFNDAIVKLDTGSEGVGDTLRTAFDPSFFDTIQHKGNQFTKLLTLGMADLGEPLGIAEERLKELDTALSGLTSAGNGEQAARIFNDIAKAAAAQGISVDDLKAKLPQYAEALAGISNAASTSGSAQSGLSSNLDAVKESAEAAKEAADKFVESLQNAGLVVLGTREANRGFQQALDDVTASIKENGKSLNVNTEKGRANQTALDAVGKSALSLAKAVYEETGSEDKMRASLIKSRASLIQTAMKFGMSKTEAEKYANSIIKIPPAKATKVTLSVVGKAQLDALQTQLHNIRDKHVTLTVGTVKVGNAKVNAGQFADGGYTGDGAKYEPAGVVHRGEYVITKAATASIGKATLDYLNARGRLPGYAGGGLVSPTLTRSVPQQLVASSRSVVASGGGTTYAPTFQVHGSDAHQATQKAMREFEYQVVGRL